MLKSASIRGNYLIARSIRDKKRFNLRLVNISAFVRQSISVVLQACTCGNWTRFSKLLYYLFPGNTQNLCILTT